MDYEELGKRAFEAYCRSVGGSTHDGKPIPQWDGLTDAVRRGWGEAAKASCLAVLEDMVRQDCRISGTEDEYTHMFMGIYEDAIGDLEDAGVMRHIGNERYVFNKA